MKITIFQGAFLPVPPLRGGAVEKMWFELGAEFAARGHHVTHVSRLCDGLPEEERLRGVRHRRVKGSDRPRGTVLGSLHDFLYTRRAAKVAPPADVVVTNTFWAPRVLRRPQGAICVDVQRMPKGQMKLYRGVARLRANSSAVAEAIAAEAPELGERVRIIPNPLPFVPERAVEWSRKAKTVLFAGRLHPEKGIELLLEAWLAGKSAGQFAGWNLELVGPVKVSEGGGGEAWLDEVKRRLPAPDVIWHPPIYDTARLNALYERATVFAYPSLAAKGETFGLAVLEAMAWGAVPVTSGLPCFRDFVVEGRNGFFFDHAAAGAAAKLGAALARAAAPTTRTVAERATDVRHSHSCAAIAAQFLDDFAQLR